MPHQQVKVPDFLHLNLGLLQSLVGPKGENCLLVDAVAIPCCVKRCQKWEKLLRLNLTYQLNIALVAVACSAVSHNLLGIVE